MAEIELSALARQCLSRRIAQADTLARHVASWQEQRNAAASQITWQFTTPDTAVKLASLYPSPQASQTTSLSMQHPSPPDKTLHHDISSRS